MATSELNQFLEDIDEKVLECAICLKRLQNPKSLTCLHSFCLDCLEDWVKKKGKLTCPTCTKSYPIPEGGLQMLPPNTLLNNLLETFEQYDKPDKGHITKGQITKCVCGKAGEYYCHDCRHSLCSSCSDYHKMMPISANHNLHTVKDVHKVPPPNFVLLDPSLCTLHFKPLELYCHDCKTPICMNCTLKKHKKGKHKPISISDAFQAFKKTSAILEKAALHFENKLQNGLEALIENAAKLEKYKFTSLQDIDSLVQEMIKTIMKKGVEMKNNIETIYEQKKQVNDVQMDELKTIISEVNTKLSFLKQLLKGDEATAMHSSETAIKALEDRVNEMPKTEPNDNGQIFFLANKHLISSLQQCDIGNVTQSMTEGLTLMGVEPVTQGQLIVAKIMKADWCNIDEYQLEATWTHHTGETNITQVDKNENGDYVVKGKCTSPGVCELDVSVDNEPIKQSPIMIKVEEEGLAYNIGLICEMNDYSGLIECENGCLLVSYQTNEMHKYYHSGEYIGKVTLPEGVKIFEMYKMNNGNIAVRDDGNNCIQIVTRKGKVIKSIGEGVLEGPTGIHVDEELNVVYVADWPNKCVFMFDIYSGEIIRKILLQGNTIGVINVWVTKEGHILALETDFVDSCNNRLLQFDNEGRFIKVLVKGDEHGMVGFSEVAVDEDDNIILTSKKKIKLFTSDGNFIKRIDKIEDGITTPCGVCLISQYPRKVAVVNNCYKMIYIYNY